jgi:hypothetical protein
MLGLLAYFSMTRGCWKIGSYVFFLKKLIFNILLSKIPRKYSRRHNKLIHGLKKIYKNPKSTQNKKIFLSLDILFWQFKYEKNSMLNYPY